MVAGIGAVGGVLNAEPPRGSGASGSFGATLGEAIARVDGEIAEAQGKAAGYVSGNDEVSLSDVMVSLEKANVALSAAAEVRDRVVQAYQQISQMQV